MKQGYIYLWKPYHFEVARPAKLFDNGWVQVEDNEPAPIEDYGDYVFSEEKISEDEALDRLMEKVDAEPMDPEYYPL